MCLIIFIMLNDDGYVRAAYSVVLICHDTLQQIQGKISVNNIFIYRLSYALFEYRTVS